MTPPASPPRPPALPWLEQFGQDVHYGLRQLNRAPGFALISILTVALGIGACTALFSVVNKVVLHPLDYPEPDRIVTVTENLLPKIKYMQVAPGVYHEWERQATVFAVLGATSGEGVKLAQGDRFLQTFAIRTTANFFSVYGLKAEKGDRVFVAVVAAGDARDDGSVRFAVEDLLAAGSIIDALATAGIDFVSPEGAAACAAFTGLRGAVAHLATASSRGHELVALGRGDEIAPSMELDVSSEVLLLEQIT